MGSVPTEMPGPARRPRVLVLVTLAETGGVQTYACSLVNGLVEEFDVTVAAWGPGPLAEQVREAGATYVPLRHVRRPLHPIRDLLGLIELIRLCRRVRPEILHLNSAKSGLLGRLAGWITRVPVRVYTAHGWAFATHKGHTVPVYLWSERLVKRLATVTVCVSRSELERGLRGRTCMPDRTVVIPNGTELDCPQMSPAADGAPLRIVSIGRFAPPKDFVTLLRAFTAIEPGSATLEILGDGPERPLIAAEISRLELDSVVTLSGDVRDVCDRVAGANLFALSTLSEGMPMTVLEAMAAGVPVVASAVGGIPELVTDGRTGVLVPPGDSQALGAALAGLVEDPELRADLGAAAREHVVRHHGAEAFRQAYVDLYRRELAARVRDGSAPKRARR